MQYREDINLIVLFLIFRFDNRETSCLEVLHILVKLLLIHAYFILHNNIVIINRFFENVNNRLGPKRDKVKEILDTLKEKGKVSKPKIGSRDAFFKLPSFIYDAPEATKQSYFKWQRISDPVNDALAYYLRTGRKTLLTELPIIHGFRFVIRLTTLPCGYHLRSWL